MTIVAGFDLSLRASGFVAVPFDWALDWSRIAVGGAGVALPKSATEAQVAQRLRTLRDAALVFVHAHGVTAVVIEAYAYTSMTTHAHALGELGGVVKLALLEAGVPTLVVSPASARKCLGKQPRSQAKVWAAQRIYGAGAPKTWTEDQVDAFVIANHFLAENGGDAIIIPEAAA